MIRPDREFEVIDPAIVGRDRAAQADGVPVSAGVERAAVGDEGHALDAGVRHRIGRQHVRVEFRIGAADLLEPFNIAELHQLFAVRERGEGFSDLGARRLLEDAGGK